MENTYKMPEGDSDREFYDVMKCKENAKLLDQFDTQNHERIIFSCPVEKWNTLLGIYRT